MNREVKSIVKVAEDQYEVESPECPMCSGTVKLLVSGPQIFRYHQGDSPSVWLREHDAETRERFITGLCSDCF